jgi:hypothetical protein
MALILSLTRDMISWDTLRLEQLIDNYVESSKFFNSQNKRTPSLDMLLKLQVRVVELLLEGITSHCWRSTGLFCSGKRIVRSICSFTLMAMISSMQFSIRHCCRFLCGLRKLVHGGVASQSGKLDKVWITFLIFCE